MADRTLVPAHDYGSGIVRAYLQLLLGGTGKPTIYAGGELISSMTHTSGTNVVTITLVDTFPKCIVALPEVRDDSANGAYATIGTITGESVPKATTGDQTAVAAALAFNINTFAAGGTASNDSTLVVGIELVLLNSRNPYGN